MKTPKPRDRFYFTKCAAYKADEVFTVTRIEGDTFYCLSSKFPDHSPLNFTEKKLAILGPIKFVREGSIKARHAIRQAERYIETLPIGAEIDFDAAIEVGEVIEHGVAA